MTQVTPADPNPVRPNIPTPDGTPVPGDSRNADDFEGPDPGGTNEHHDEPASGDGGVGYPVGGNRAASAKER